MFDVVIVVVLGLYIVVDMGFVWFGLILVLDCGFVLLMCFPLFVNWLGLSLC